MLEDIKSSENNKTKQKAMEQAVFGRSKHVIRVFRKVLIEVNFK